MKLTKGGAHICNEAREYLLCLAAAPLPMAVEFLFLGLYPSPIFRLSSGNSFVSFSEIVSLNSEERRNLVLCTLGFRFETDSCVLSLPAAL